MIRNWKLTASAAALALGAAWASEAMAADAETPVAQDGSSYISLFGGFAQARGQMATSYYDFYYSGNDYGYQVDFKMKNGFTVGAAVGHQVGNGLRVESEFAFISNDVDGGRVDGGSFSDTGDFNVESRSLFLTRNVWRDIRISDRVQPYFGAGLGVGYTWFSGGSGGEEDDTVSGLGLAAQAGAGIRVALTDRLALDAGYRIRALIDASFEGKDDISPNSSFSHYTQTAQIGLSYSLGADSRILTSPSDGESSWYVSLFGGGNKSTAYADYSNYSLLIVDHKRGFTVGGAIGSEVAPGLRMELEASYSRNDLDEMTFEGDATVPASGTQEQGYLLANLWKDINLGRITAYVGGGLGIGALRSDDPVYGGVPMTGDTGIGLAGQFGFGAKLAMTDNIAVDIGYRLKTISDALVNGEDATGPFGIGLNSELSSVQHVLQAGIVFGPGASSTASAAVDNSRYMMIYGGGVMPIDSFASVHTHSPQMSFENGFVGGAAIGTHVTEHLRAELEFSHQRYDADEVNFFGIDYSADGKVSGTFVMGNLWYNRNLGPASVYAGGGLGAGLSSVDIDYDGHQVDDTFVGLAGQIGAGVQFDLTDSLALDVGYRLRTALAVASEGVPGDYNGISTYYTHIGQVGFVWRF